MGIEYSKEGEDFGESSVNDEPITYFAINIKQPDKLHVVPADRIISNLIVKV